ncbi:hypothetical protein AMTRI_Chr07g75350 [Amborella trichopoda]
MEPLLVLFCLSYLLTLISATPDTMPKLPFMEEEALYNVLEAINPSLEWRTMYPSDLCNSGPHGVLCDLFNVNGENDLHVIELSFGFVSEYNPNAPCNNLSTVSPSMASFPFIRKLFFYNCFNNGAISFPDYIWEMQRLEELIFTENFAIIGELSEKVRNLKSLRRMVLSGTRVSGQIPKGIGELVKLEQLVISRSRFNGEIPKNLGFLRNLRVLDLSFNSLEGPFPEELGFLPELLKLDMGSNKLSGSLPKTLPNLQKLKFMDFSHNFLGFGVPPFLGEMPNLEEIYLSGNPLGGEIPEIFAKLGGILGLGLCNAGLMGKIPASMGIFLKRVNYLGFEGNFLEGEIPKELGFLERVNEMNLGNNRLSGRVLFSAKFMARIGEKLNLEGNEGLCLERNGGGGGYFGYLRGC